MFSRSTWLHLRIPFSFFLLPIYLFALAISPNFGEHTLFWSFLIIHLFLYPASNGYNSYFDKDEKSIGGLKNPPPVTKGLYYISLLFDLVAIILGWLMISTLFAVMLFIYGLASKAYSHPSIRLKKYATAGWLITGFFQGFFTLLMCYVAINNFGIENLLKAKVLIPAALSSCMLLGNYPMTQIYQHDEDKKHGDMTLSIKLGIRGTFYFVQAVFGLTVVGFAFYFKSFHTIYYSWIFLLSLSPVLIFFGYWFFNVWKDEAKANYSNTMWLNLISAVCLNAFFIYFFFSISHLGQYL
jgi:1,4-dihydroxy-2-naphthoate octaprenyltransferase